MCILANTAIPSHEIALLFLATGLLLAMARLLGEFAKRLGLPSVLGELLAGVFLGPTILGWAFPHVEATIFPPAGEIATAIHAFTALGIALFLLVAGMEVDLSTVWRQGRSAVTVAVMGMAIPFILGFGLAWMAPRWLGIQPNASHSVFALFVAIALAITALPVIAKILMDLHLYRSNIGMVIVAAAILNDLVGWLVFAFLIGLMGGKGPHAFTITQTVLLTLAFAVCMLTLGRWLIDRILPWFQAHASWPGGIIGTALAMALLCAAFTEWIGVHAIFGAFMFGVALGDSRHLREQTRATLDQFISFFFAPLFFATIGLEVNFATNFDLPLILIITLIATIGKIVGCGLGARWSGFSNRQAWAVGFGMNARGAMEIILGLLAMEAGLINQRLFVALVVMAMLTSLFSGSMIQWVLGGRKRPKLSELLTSNGFVKLQATDRRSAVNELVQALRTKTDGDSVDREAINWEGLSHRVWAREHLLPTNSEHGLAIVRASFMELKEPLIAVGASSAGIDFMSPDKQPAKLICLLLTHPDELRLQRSLLSDISRSFEDSEHVDHAVGVTNFTEFLALLNSGKPAGPPVPAKVESVV
jgi:Kef-type K+ transport system membrane component KefB